MIKNVNSKEVELFGEIFGLVFLFSGYKFLLLCFFFREKYSVDIILNKEDFECRKCKEKWKDIKKCYFDFMDSEDDYWLKYKYKYKEKKKYKYKYKSKYWDDEKERFDKKVKGNDFFG